MLDFQFMTHELVISKRKVTLGIFKFEYRIMKCYRNVSIQPSLGTHREFHSTLRKFPALEVTLLKANRISHISDASFLSVYLADLVGIRLKYLLVLLTR